MRIGIDARLLDKALNTGISRYTEFIIQYYISKYGESNIYLITNDIKLKYGNCKIEYSSYRPYNIIHFLFYWRWIKKLDFDLLHITFYSGLFRDLKNTKVVVTVHDLMYRLIEGFFGKNKLINKFKIWYFDFIVRNTIKNADVIISVSDSTRADLLTNFHTDSYSVPEFSIIDTAEDESIISDINVERKGYFFYCGNNRPHKNLQAVIDIFNNNEDIPPLVLAGKGHQASKNVIVTGVVSEEQLKSLYKNAIAFIFPSRYEGFGLPVLEALNSKTKVVASLIPAFTEFKSENIRFFELDNEDSLLSSIRQSMSNNYTEEPHFFDKYSVNHIYSLLDQYCSI